MIDADTRAARTIACSVEGYWWGLAQVDRTLFCAPFAADAVLTIDAPPPPMAAQVAEALGAGNARAAAECLRTPDAPVMCEILCALNVLLGLNMYVRLFFWPYMISMVVMYQHMKRKADK